MSDFTKMKVDDVSEARFRRELMNTLKESLNHTAMNVNLDLLFNDVVPSLVSSVSALIKAIEDEEEKKAIHKQQMKKNPGITARRELNPLHWLASHLMRHNSRYAQPTGHQYVFPDRNMLSPDQMDEVKETFSLLDDGSGKITRDHLRDALRGMGKNYSVAGVRLLLAKIGIEGDNNGLLSFNDYVQVFNHFVNQKSMEMMKLKEASIKKMQLSGEELKNLEQQFALYDLNGDGKINRREVYQCLSTVGSYTEDQINSFIDTVDTDHDGQVDFAEFARVNRRQSASAKNTSGGVGGDGDDSSSDEEEEAKDKRSSKQAATPRSIELSELKEQFDKFDKNGNGTIEASEVRAVLVAAGYPDCGEDELKAIMEQCDTNANGRIEFNEFCKSVLSRV